MDWNIVDEHRENEGVEDSKLKFADVRSGKRACGYGCPEFLVKDISAGLEGSSRQPGDRGMRSELPSHRLVEFELRCR